MSQIFLISQIFKVGFVGVSIQTSLVSGVNAFSTLLSSVMSTNENLILSLSSAIFLMYL